ncbi:hypothetical protein J4450_01395 [Candidatus Micrarchaeota archaeon]|nr:hypothetical protein [Candidatus Micrarchaeota archaeon]
MNRKNLFGCEYPMPPGSDPNPNKNTIRMVTANTDNSIHASTKVDLRSFRNRDTLLDVTKAGFGADKVQAPYIESEFDGVKTSGHEVKQIGDLVKIYDKESNPNAERDGFQAYFVVVSNGQTEKAGLPFEAQEGKKEFLNADNTTVDKLRKMIEELPENAELVIVWRRDVDKTKDITVDSSSFAPLVVNQSNSGFDIPRLGGGGFHPELNPELVLDDGLYLFTDKGEDRITFSTEIVKPIVNQEYLWWDAGIMPILQYPTPALQIDPQSNQAQRFIYLDGVLTSTIEYFKPDDPKPPPISIQIWSATNNDGSNSQKIGLADKQLVRSQLNHIVAQEESMIMRLLMNPTERKLWGKMYGLPDDEDARSITRGDEFINVSRVREDSNYDSPKDDGGPKDAPKGSPTNPKNGFTMSDNDIEFEKSDEKTQHPSRLMFTTLFEKQDDAQPEVEENRDDPDKFGMKVVIGDLKPKKKKTPKKAREESTFIPPKLLDTNRNKKAKRREAADKEHHRKSKKSISDKQKLPNILTKDAKTPKKKINNAQLKEKFKYSNIPSAKREQLDITKQSKKSEKKKVPRTEKPKVAKRDMIVLGGSPFAAIPSSKPATAKAKKINKDYKLLWTLGKNGNKFKNAKRERTNR